MWPIRRFTIVTYRLSKCQISFGQTVYCFLAQSALPCADFCSAPFFSSLFSPRVCIYFTSCRCVCVGYFYRRFISTLGDHCVACGLEFIRRMIDATSVDWLMCTTRCSTFFLCFCFAVSGLSQRSLRVCQAKRVAPPIVPESASSGAGGQQQQHRHSGSSFDSGGSSSAESSSGGYCSGSGSLSSCHAPSSSAWSQTGSDQRSSIGLDDAFLPPPPSSPAAHSVANKHHHMYSRGMCRHPHSGTGNFAKSNGSLRILPRHTRVHDSRNLTHSRFFFFFLNADRPQTFLRAPACCRKLEFVVFLISNSNIVFYTKSLCFSVCRPCLIVFLVHYLHLIGENEPVYSGRNLGSPGFGGPGGIFTYPSVSRFFFIALNEMLIQLVCCRMVSTDR